MTVDESFFEITPNSWEEAKGIGKVLRYCIFRGHSDMTWPLETAIERAATQFNCPPNAIWDREKTILREFKSRAHHYLQSPPKDDKQIEWLSIIQHYGGPTRLLDFTESFYLAAFFAMESATKDACVWAISDLQLNLAAEKNKLVEFELDKPYPLNLEPILLLAEEFVNDDTKKDDFVLKVMPTRLNERLAIQKGVFLFPCNLENSFESNLCKAFGFSFNKLLTDYATDLKYNEVHDPRLLLTRVMKINLPRSIHREAISDLYSMNIDAASLFPGLDGFARSLRFSVRIMEKSITKTSQVIIPGYKP